MKVTAKQAIDAKGFQHLGVYVWFNSVTGTYCAAYNDGTHIPEVDSQSREKAKAQVRSHFLKVPACSPTTGKEFGAHGARK